MIISIILAAGKGTRLKSQKENKVALIFNGRPIITYGVDLFESIAQTTIVVIGAFAESVEKALEHRQVIFVRQERQLGTGDAAKRGLSKAEELFSDILSSGKHQVLVGYGDHLMFYKSETVKNMINFHKENRAEISIATTIVPNSQGYGRIKRNNQNTVEAIVEEKEANEEEKKIVEINSGLYCFDFGFLKKNLDKIKTSLISGEYYLTDLVEIAVKQNKKVIPYPINFKEVGIGINTKDELQSSQRMYRALSDKK